MDSKRAWRAGCLSIIISAVGFACGRDDSERSGSRSDAVTTAMPDTTFACALVQDLRSRFTISSPLPIAHAADGGLPVGLPNQAMLPLGIADAFVSAPETIQPHWPAQEGANAKSTVALPARSGSPFALTELGSSTSIKVSLVGARDVAVQTCAGFAVYPGAGPNGEDVLHRPTPQGTEDYVSLNRAPPTGEMVYQITLDPHVAGLRLVANTLEFVEASGSPRLRIAAPYLVDSSRKRIDAQIALEGCAADTNPAGPWGRAITPPGASTCRVHVAWDSATVAYPALLDPSWTATGSMVTGRYYQATSLLQSGKVLVAGGIAPNGVQVATAEIYDPGSGAWATTGSLRYPTFGAFGGTLQTGKVLVAGGYNFLQQAMAVADVYEPTTGVWTAQSDMVVPRGRGTGSVLANGNVLVAGGDTTYGGTTQIASSEEFNPVTGAWTLKGYMASARVSFSANVLGNGKVLVAGGWNSGPGTLSGVELYDSATGLWTAKHALTTARYAHSGTLTMTGFVLVAGGGTNSPLLASAELYNPIADTWASAGNLSVARFAHTAIKINDGSILVAGGSNGSVYLASAEVYSPGTNSWSTTAPLATARFGYSMAVLPSGNVLVGGGYGNASSALTSSELYAPASLAGTFCGDGGPSVYIPPADVPAMKLTSTNVDQFIVWMDGTRQNQSAAVKSAILDAASDTGVINALITRVSATPFDGRTDVLSAMDILGLMKATSSVSVLNNLANTASGICQDTPTPGSSCDFQGCAALYQARAVEMMASIGGSTADSNTISIAKNHPSRAVRAAAADAYLFNHGDSKIAVSTLQAQLSFRDQQLIGQPRLLRTEDAAAQQAFDTAFLGMYAQYPAERPPLPVSVDAGSAPAASCAHN